MVPIRNASSGKADIEVDRGQVLGWRSPFSQPADMVTLHVLVCQQKILPAACNEPAEE